MKETKSNIVLIGMPGSGKSTVGVILAKNSSHDFLDTDVLIQVSEKRTLQNIIDTEGYIALREVEENILLDLSCRNHIISTGGSAVYSEKAMQHLKKDGLFIFLDASLETLKERVMDFTTRGLAKRPDQSFEELFDERMTLYRKYADITIKCDDLTQDEVCDTIIEKISRAEPQSAQRERKLPTDDTGS